jgi:hypothetical protein
MTDSFDDILIASCISEKVYPLSVPAALPYTVIVVNHFDDERCWNGLNAFKLSSLLTNKDGQALELIFSSFAIMSKHHPGW